MIYGIFKTVRTAGIIVLLSSAMVWAQDGLALMKVEAGARPAGMAGAFVSIPGAPNSVFYNPAGAAGTDRFKVSFGHNTYWENVRLETGYAISNLTDRSWIHGGIRYAAVSDLESRLAPTSEPEAYFDSHDASLKGGLTYQITPQLAAGVAAGWFIEKIDAYRGSAFNMDLGLLFHATPELNFGAAVTNLGSDFSLSVGGGKQGTQDISIPTTYRAGGSYHYDRYLGAADLVVVDDKAHLHLGLEGQLHEYVTFRTGYMFNYDSKNFTAGVTFSHRNVAIDYAFVPYSNDLGTSHLFNLTLTL
jgi:hypothetical protein